jgi:L-ascorbate metabolism protein UlaG (beta-lactamase superfamily)
MQAGSSAEMSSAGDELPPVTITWVGHATAIIDIGGVRVLTDPALTKRLVHLTRRQAPPELDPVDAVLISHLHMDHLHLPSLRTLQGEPELVVPAGAGRLVRGVPASTVAEVAPSDRFELTSGTATVDVEVITAEHSGRRGPHSRHTAPPLGYVLRAGGRSVYFPGDTDLFDGMADLGPVDVALLPIWGWGASLGEGHLNPQSAVRATELIDPAVVIPIHWGTFSPVRARRGSPPWLGRPLDEFTVALDRRGLGDRLLALAPGGSASVGGSGIAVTGRG